MTRLDLEKSDITTDEEFGYQDDRHRRRNRNTTISTNSRSIRAVSSSIGALDPDLEADPVEEVYALVVGEL